MLFLASALLYYVMEHSSEAEDCESLADQVEVLRSILRDKPEDFEALKMEIQVSGAVGRFAKYYARVLTKDGKVVIQTQNMDQLLPPPDRFPPAVKVSGSSQEGRLWKAPKKMRPRKSHEGKYFLLMSAWADLGSPAQDTRLLQLALDVTQDETVLDEYRRMLAVGRNGFCKTLPINGFAGAVQRATPAYLGRILGRILGTF